MADTLRPPPLPPSVPPATPPQPFPPAPSVAIANQISGVGQLVAKKLKEHGDLAELRFDVFHRELALIRQQIVPDAKTSSGSTNDTMPSPAPTSLPMQIAGHTMNVAKWGTLAIGVLGIAAQVAKVWRPSLVAPLDQLLDIAKQAFPGVVP
jgi:hypothetical protein